MPNYRSTGVYATPSGPAIGNSPLSGTLPGSSLFQNFTPNVPEYADEYWDPVSGTFKSRSKSNNGGNPAGVSDPNLVKVPYSNESINPNDPNQRYRPVDIVKSPDIVSGQATLMDSFKKGAEDSLKGFDEYLTNFKTALGNAFNKSQQATDPTQTIAELRGAQSRYSAGIDRNAADYAALNQDTAARERAIVTEARDLIPQFDTAQNNAEALQAKLLQNQVSRYKVGSGTPMSMGSAEQQQLVEGAGRIAVPIELAKIGQRYNVLNQYALPVEQNIAGMEQQRIGSFTPQQLAAQFQSGTFTTQAIQQLLQTTASMAQDEAVRYMQAIGVPAQVQQSILSGQIQQLGALGQIEDQSRYRGLQDVLGAYPTASQSYSLSTPSFPSPSRYSPTGRTSTGTSGLDASNAPVSVSSRGQSAPAGAIGDYVWDGTNRRWQNWRTGAAMPQGFTPPTAETSQWDNNPDLGGWTPGSTDEAYNLAQF